jgi:hypothetical protein
MYDWAHTLHTQPHVIVGWVSSCRWPFHLLTANVPLLLSVRLLTVRDATCCIPMPGFRSRNTKKRPRVPVTVAIPLSWETLGSEPCWGAEAARHPRGSNTAPLPLYRRALGSNSSRQ